MNHALDAALRAALTEGERALAAGDVPVGAVVLDTEGAIIGRGHNEREATGDPTGHAEVLALRAAARTRGEWRLSGCTLVVTLEPCVMCAGATVLSRIDRLVYGARDPKAGAAGSLWDLVRDPRLNHRPEVVPPDLVGAEVAADCAGLLTRFFSERRG
ncbi:nucleoside deaminase [Nocardiopsis sp. N85]|uniref:nucleoside deaminase n=1 Tax=Nocardiopsis sp. N85 TaxID=3029400 RepID=UPI00237F35F3|nr:nucleoside deaminase [Nocardiopsis sp. N85]MDE3723461.1 nucleoside deaminase [Nocardiopsis sp. N85]